MSKFLCILAAVAAFSLQAFEIERHTNVVVRNGMTLSQKGGLSDSDYVVTDIESGALDGKVSSVNGETGAVVITTQKLGAVPATRTINGKGLGANIALTPDDIGAVAAGSVVGSPCPLAKYLHELSFDDSYPDEAQEYYRRRGNGKTDGGCSAVRDGGLMYRNFDYPFDERAEFVVRMSAGAGRFASVGVAQVGTNLTEDIVTSGRPEFSRLYKWLPGATVDGINERGVAVTINVTDDVPSWHSTGSLHPLGVVRWILDHATNALHGAEYAAANVRFPAGWVQNFHYMVADRGKTYLVENGEVYDFDDYHESDEPAAMTNFPLNRFPWDGMGMERFGLLLRGESITNAWYTRAYRRETTPPWTSEFPPAVLALTNEIFDAWSSHPREYFRSRTNGGEPWWQTVHTSVYDLTDLTLRICVQESGDWYSFAVQLSGLSSNEVRNIAVQVTGGKRDIDDFNVYEAVKDHWTWSVLDEEDDEINRFISLANRPGASKPYYDGEYPYWYCRDISDFTFGSPAGSGDGDATNLVMLVNRPNSQGDSFFVVASRLSADDSSPVAFDTIALTSQLQAPPVTSVNSKTGAVTLSASDVGAATPQEVAGITNADNVAIGQDARFSRTAVGQTAIGRDARTTNNRALAIGRSAVASNSNSIAIGYNAKSHGANTFNAAPGLGSWWAGDELLLDALLRTGYVMTNVEEVVTNDPPVLASGRFAAGPGQVFTNRFRAYVPDPNAPKPVLSGLETAKDLAAMLADVNTNDTSDCDCARSNLTEFVKGPVNEVKDRHWDPTLGVEWTLVSDNGEFMFVATTNVNREALQ